MNTRKTENRVLQTDYSPSLNFYGSDLLLQGSLNQLVDGASMDYLQPLLERLGMQAAQEMDALSLKADKHPPVLVKRNRWGEGLDAVDFHPAYWSLMEVAVGSEMLRIKWEPGLRARFAGQRHAMGFALGFLYAMSESGQYCPLCMTDGVALLIDQFCTAEDRERLLPHIYADRLSDFYTGAMFLTEKAGGSDVGANLVEARSIGDGHYSLHGEKWFCSNVNAQLIFALARTDSKVAGTRGLSIFLVERNLPDGSPNPLNIVRLKDKLGTRSMASGECLLDGTIGKLVGQEYQGFRVMTEMINLSRMYNSVAALAGGRRGLIEAWQFLQARVTFGKVATSHSLVRAKLWELSSLYRGSHALVWRAIGAMDESEGGSAEATELLRMLTPMAKRDSAEMAVYVCRESMELMGGMGYIEDTVLPKTMRDVMVLPIWEGAGNIMVLDMLRAASKTGGLGLLLVEINRCCEDGGKRALDIVGWKQELGLRVGQISELEQDALEYQAKGIFLELTRCLQAALLHRAARQGDEGASLAADYLLKAKFPSYERKAPPDVPSLVTLMAWRH